MSPSSSDASDAPTPSAPDEPQGINPWIVRFFLILAFGLAFGIEGMTLVRSYLLDREGGEQVESEEGKRNEAEAPERTPLRIGDDLLPSTSVSERVAQMRIQAQSDGPWVFRLAVTVVNDGDYDDRLSLRGLKTDDGTVFDDVQSVTCPPGDSTRLVATWPIGADARPAALTAEAELQQSDDSTRTVRRRVAFGHVPVRMRR
ncbi:MAG: hypothetical protein ABEK84_02990 [Salinibacter sp.]